MSNAATTQKAIPAAFVVVYRTGGFARFQWHRTVPVPTLAEALVQHASLKLAGYHALYPQDALRSLSLGLPETFDASCSIQ